MSRLVILRHAHAADAPGLDDIDRPLNRRGHDEAVQAAKWLAAQGIAPDAVVASTALRVRQTLEPFGFADVAYDARLYNASLDLVLAVLRGVTGETVLVAGHNPAMHDLVVRLTDEPLDRGFPPGAIAVLDDSALTTFWRP
jgi:phosphohistidine phosphatase